MDKIGKQGEVWANPEGAGWRLAPEEPLSRVSDACTGSVGGTRGWRTAGSYQVPSTFTVLPRCLPR